MGSDRVVFTESLYGLVLAVTTLSIVHQRRAASILPAVSDPFDLPEGM